MKIGDTLNYYLFFGFNDGKSFLGITRDFLGLYYIDE